MTVRFRAFSPNESLFFVDFRAGKGWLFWRLCILLVMVLFVRKNGASSVVNVCACIIFFFTYDAHYLHKYKEAKGHAFVHFT